MQYFRQLQTRMVDELGDTKVYVELMARTDALPRKPDARLKLICAGFSRTGTLSMYSALTELGIKTYHGVELTKRDISKRWNEVVGQELRTGNVDGVDWQKVTEGYEAGLDLPFCDYWKELFQAFPDAKVVYTHRDGNAWLKSIRAAIVKPMVLNRPYQWAVYWFPEQREMLKVVKMTFRKYERVYGGLHAGLMDERLAEVKKHIPSEQLLVFHPREGWEPLCSFLGLPIPEGPFPNINDGNSMTMVFTAVTMVGMSLWAASIAILVGIFLWIYARL